MCSLTMNLDFKNVPFNGSVSVIRKGSPEGNSTDQDSECESTKDQNIRRGRPRSDAITSLIFKGAVSISSIRCNVCNRVFPREKSLQAHMRTHTVLSSFKWVKKVMKY
ncbi:hypothetical protein KUTeg_015836 [Tegillarca granosa]|uniref:C2H2-type domain-containing protein n=1 Tax=Tegillarca granosa TaxID=220873 RepID=A0ABQ9EN27_TEGGR|nr:hypothetical protein KUTeg_015836 [Tegillarca granosa]